MCLPDPPAKQPPGRSYLKSEITHRPQKGLLHGSVTSDLAGPEGWAWKDAIKPKPYPKEFREDVVRVARAGEPGVTVQQVAADFGVHAMTLWKWLRAAGIEDGTKPGTTVAESAELRQTRSRIRLLEQENEVLRRAAANLSQANLPGKGSTRS